MDSASLLKQTYLKIILVIIGMIIFLSIPISLPANLGVIDFRPYWSSSYLLAHGQDFSDPAKLDHIERTLTGWQEPYTMYAWFAPTGNLILLPYTLFPFARASYYWLITNIVIVFFCAVLLWRNTKIHFWIPLSATFGFSMVLLSLLYGQVNTLVLLGLALFLFFSESRHDFAAGASLVLTTIKPHLVILTLPLLLLDIVWHKQWRILIGFIGALMGCTFILFIFYPLWPISFLQVISSGMSTFREAPTIPGLFVMIGDRMYGKWVWVIGLFLAILICWKRKNKLHRRTLMDFSIIAGIIVSPVGWSYDQVMLLFPLLHVLEWASTGSLTRKDAMMAVFVLIFANIMTFYERVLVVNEVWFFWVPFIVLAVYLFAWQTRTGRRAPKILPLGHY